MGLIQHLAGFFRIILDDLTKTRLNKGFYKQKVGIFCPSSLPPCSCSYSCVKSTNVNFFHFSDANANMYHTIKKLTKTYLNQNQLKKHFFSTNFYITHYTLLGTFFITYEKGPILAFFNNNLALKSLVFTMKPVKKNNNFFFSQNSEAGP